MITAEQRQALETFQRDPNLFFRKVLGCDPETYQERINQAIADNDRVAVSACHDVGKSWDLARIVLWFVTCFPYSKVITTAPTYNQVKNILWSEIRSAYSKSRFPLGGRMNLTEWQVTPEGDWFAIGFTPKNELSGEAGQGTQSSFQGFHAPHILLVFDEATGVPQNIWAMAEGILTSDSVKFVAIANPTSRASQFYKCFQSPAWTKIKLNCFDSPNLIANNVTTIEALQLELDRVKNLNDDAAQARLKTYIVTRPHLLTLKWVVERAIEWGLDHPLFVSKVLGTFPEDADGTLIPLGAVEQAQLRLFTEPQPGDRKVIGVDVARYGADSTVITGYHGKKPLFKKKMQKSSNPQVVGAVIDLVRTDGPFDVIVVDETGVGSGVVDLLQEKQSNDIEWRNTEIRGVQFGAAPICTAEGCKHVNDCDKAKFVNLKARMFKLLSDDIKAQDGLQLADEAVYLDELPTILYFFDSKGRMFIESKDDYKKRTGRGSPDDSDSLALANFGRYDEMTVGRFEVGHSTGFAPPFAASLGGNRQW